MMTALVAAAELIIRLSICLNAWPYRTCLSNEVNNTLYETILHTNNVFSESHGYNIKVANFIGSFSLVRHLFSGKDLQKRKIVGGTCGTKLIIHQFPKGTVFRCNNSC